MRTAVATCGRIAVFLAAILAFHTSNAQRSAVDGIAVAGSEAFQVLCQFYDYDASRRLAINVIERIEKADYVREKFSFEGHSGQVPGYLALPRNRSHPYPIVLLLHGLTGSKENWWEPNTTLGKLTEQLLASGYAVLTLDAEFHGERSGNNPFESPVAILENEWFVCFRDMMIQSVIDYRRALDYLATREDVDASKVGMIGNSMGGVMTFILSAVDARIDAAVSCVSPIVDVPYLPTGVLNFAPYISETPLLMLMGEKDERNYSVPLARQLHNLIACPNKKLVFFDSGHTLPPEWIYIATNWLAKNLGSSYIENK
ncbi:alpha/beta hydrolase family protein [Parapedobacter deserti]|uniref:Alpha/beta hydrolase family protein n=1 Tax=Parapedobacter deserti TaxID=1912957 RepID=A0ABV7JMS9_9SPHI